METSEGRYGWTRRHREDFEAKVKSSMPSFQRNAGKIRSFFQKDALMRRLGENPAPSRN
jgi:hypothetical protein